MVGHGRAEAVVPAFQVAPPGSAQHGAIASLARNPDHVDVFWVTPNGRIGSVWWQRGERIRMHLKVLFAPTSFTVNQMVAAMMQVYASVDIDVEILSTENLNQPLLWDIRVGDCRTTISNDQTNLFNNRNNVGADEIVAYFVRSTIPGLNGCARPQAEGQVPSSRAALPSGLCLYQIGPRAGTGPRHRHRSTHDGFRHMEYHEPSTRDRLRRARRNV